MRKKWRPAVGRQAAILSLNEVQIRRSELATQGKNHLPRVQCTCKLARRRACVDASCIEIEAGADRAELRVIEHVVRLPLNSEGAPFSQRDDLVERHVEIDRGRLPEDTEPRVSKR